MTIKTGADAWTENDLLKHVRQMARNQGYLEYHTLRSIGSTAGFPDLVLVRPPRVIFAELKRNKAQLRTAQVAWKVQLEDCPGVEYYVWRPDDLEDILKILGG